MDLESLRKEFETLLRDRKVPFQEVFIEINQLLRNDIGFNFCQFAIYKVARLEVRPEF